MKLWKLISAFASAALVALVFSAIHANAAVDRVCNYTVGSTTTATGFANCTEEIGDLSTKAVAIVSSYTGTNDIVATSAPAVTSLVDGQLVQFTATATSSGSMTFKLDSTTARSIYKTDGTTALGAGDIVSGRRYLLSYKASTTRWLLMGIPTAAEVSNTPAGNISATTVQAAITELDNEKQPLDTDLTCFAGLTSAADKISYFTGVGTCATADFSAAIRTLITTPSSANMAALVTDETGTNKLVFSDNPVLVTPNLGTPSAVNLANGTALPVSGLSGLGSGVGTALGTGTNAAGGIPLQSGSPVALNCVRWKSGGGLEDAGATCGGGGGGGSPGGTNGQIQWNNAGAFDGFTASGDATINTGTGAVTIANDAVTYAKMQNVGANSVLANNTGSSGDAAEVALSASQLLGRGSSGNVAAISLGTGLSMSGTTLVPGSPVYIGSVMGTNAANVDLALGATYSSILAQCTYINASAASPTATVAVSDDNASTYGTGLTFASGGTAVAMYGGSFTISGTGASATNKVVTPYLAGASDMDAGANSSSYSTTATETTKTGVTTHLRFVTNNANARYSCTVFGIP